VSCGMVPLLPPPSRKVAHVRTCTLPYTLAQHLRSRLSVAVMEEEGEIQLFGDVVFTFMPSDDLNLKEEERVRTLPLDALCLAKFA